MNATRSRSIIEVDVVIPVYGQLELARRCIQSVLNSSCNVGLNLIVIDDFSPDEYISVELQKMADEFQFLFIRNTENLGFPETCNRAFALDSKNDILILNSDTEVYGNWLDRIVKIAYSDSSIGTVTPLTNDGEICSYPHWLRPNPVTLDITGHELDLLAATLNAGEWHPAPTGVGFCMYFKRDCLASVGLFDSEAFGKGYGEENDFCQRAIEAGWINAITPSVFVRHEGGGSFGPSKAARIASAIQVLSEKHPGYNKAVEDFIRNDPLKLARERLDVGRVKRRTLKNAVLMVTHNWGGGTERHVRDLIHSLESSGVATLVCRPSENNPDLIEVFDKLTPEIPNLQPLKISDPPELFAERLRSLGVSHVHIHNLAGYSELIRDLIPSALSKSEITYDVTIHDYQYWCPQITLVGVTGMYCGEPSTNSCQSCVRTISSPFGNVSVWDWRRGYEILLREARVVYAPSNDAAKRVERHLPGLSVQVRPHELLSHRLSIETTKKPHPQSNPISSRNDRKRIGIIGAISKEKGAEILFETAKHFDKKGLPIEFIVIGHTFDDELFSLLTNVKIAGRYEEHELEDILFEENLDAIWFPAVWPETYSFTLTAARKTGLPITSFDVGAISERLRTLDRGIVMPLLDARNLEKVTQTLLETVARAPGSVYESKNSITDRPMQDYYGLH